MGSVLSKICCVTAPVGMFSGGSTELRAFLVSLCLLTQDDLQRSTDLLRLYIDLLIYEIDLMRLICRA